MQVLSSERIKHRKPILSDNALEGILDTLTVVQL